MVTEEKIWEYLDGSLNESTRQEVEYAIAHDAEAASLFRNISDMHSLLKIQTPEQPSMCFTDQVMHAIQPEFQYIPAAKVPIRPILLTALPFVILIFIVSGMMIDSHSPSSHSFYISTHVINILKLLFLLIDSILLILFIEKWYESRRKYHV